MAPSGISEPTFNDSTHINPPPPKSDRMVHVLDKSKLTAGQLIKFPVSGSIYQRGEKGEIRRAVPKPYRNKKERRRWLKEIQ